jgi:multidrug efflux pump subunit AcrA (membrane-fusion protein)
MAQKSGSDTVVTSPINGVVAQKLKNTGELATMMPPTVVLIIQDVSKLELRARLPERSLAQIAPGSNIRAFFPALNTTRDVTIKRINPSIDPRTRTVEIVAEMDNPDGKLKSGMLAEIHIAAEAPAPAVSATKRTGKD